MCDSSKECLHLRLPLCFRTLHTNNKCLSSRKPLSFITKQKCMLWLVSFVFEFFMVKAVNLKHHCLAWRQSWIIFLLYHLRRQWWNKKVIFISLLVFLIPFPGSGYKNLSKSSWWMGRENASETVYGSTSSWDM